MTDLNPDGPHSPDRTREVGQLFDDASRFLCYATMERHGGLDYPADVYALVADFYAATGRFPQMCEQLGQFLSAQPPDRLYEARGRSVTGRVPDGPVEVSLDLTAIRMRRFHPPTGRRGTYIESGFGGRDRVFRWAGDCAGCGQRTWAHDDGADDVRGAFGWWTACPLTSGNFADGQVPADASWPRCGACWNSSEKTEEIERKILARAAGDAGGAAGDAGPALTLF
jgi:hypothetical protein